MIHEHKKETLVGQIVLLGDLIMAATNLPKAAHLVTCLQILVLLDVLRVQKHINDALINRCIPLILYIVNIEHEPSQFLPFLACFSILLVVLFFVFSAFLAQKIQLVVLVEHCHEVPAEIFL